MRAVVMTRPGGPEVLQLQEIAPPEITRDDEMRVRVKAAGVNPIDTKLRRRGTYGDVPAVLGCDGAGIVETVGNGVRRFRPGDAVYYCYGGIGLAPGNDAEYAVVPEAVAARKPAALSFIEAAAAPLVLITAWESLFDRARLQAGARVLIHAGAGGVGHVAVQLARIQGAAVAATVSSPEKAEFVRRLGAEVAIDYTKEDVVDAVMDWTDGRGADVVLDTVGGEVFNLSLACAKPYGDVVTILQVPDDADWKLARNKNLRVSQELMLTPMIRGDKAGLRHQGHILAQCGSWFDAGRLKVHVRHRLPLAQADRAHRLIEAGHMTGKVVLEI